VAEVGDIDLAAPIADEDFAAIAGAFAEYGVLVFPEQRLSQVQQLAFAARFGPLESNLLGYNNDAEFRLHPTLVDISNLTARSTIWAADSRMRQFYLGNQLWHTDSSFKFVPALCSLLYAHRIAPIGGHTEFADMRAAYAALDRARQAALAGVIAVHALAYSRARIGFAEFTAAENQNLPPVPQLLIRVLPESGRRTLYLASHIGGIVGMAEAAARELVDELMTHATQRQFCYLHRWRSGDLVMWDNRATMHRGTPFDDQRYVRDLHRATVSDRDNSCRLAGVEPPVLARAS
jgi:alpha-ketoglutarate-dependent 2,4-dichlorophenoxyacetate dioxygenase